LTQRTNHCCGHSRSAKPDREGSYLWRLPALIDLTAGSFLCSERMLDLIALGDHFCDLWLARGRPSHRFLGGAIIVVLAFLAIRRLPVNEDTDTTKQIVGLILRDHTFRHAIGHSLADRMLSWTEHLNGLLGAFDRDFVKQHRCGLAH